MTLTDSDLDVVKFNDSEEVDLGSLEQQTSKRISTSFEETRRRESCCGSTDAKIVTYIVCKIRNIVERTKDQIVIDKYNANRWPIIYSID